MSRRRLLIGLAVLPLALGLWQIGEAGYIHAKALLAQHLIAKAWAETLTGSRAVRPWPRAASLPVARPQAIPAAPSIGERAMHSATVAIPALPGAA